jgi:hypothetical protein
MEIQSEGGCLREADETEHKSHDNHREKDIIDEEQH